MQHCVNIGWCYSPPQVQTYLNIQREQQAIPFSTISLCKKGKKKHWGAQECKLSILLWSEKPLCLCIAWDANIPVLFGCFSQSLLQCPPAVLLSGVQRGRYQSLIVIYLCKLAVIIKKQKKERLRGANWYPSSSVVIYIALYWHFIVTKWILFSAFVKVTLIEQ